MGIIYDTITNAKSVAENVGKKAENILDISKLRFTESGIKSAISKKMQALGIKVYNLEKNGNYSVEKIQKKIKEIDQLQEELNATQSLIKSVKSRDKGNNDNF